MSPSGKTFLLSVMGFVAVLVVLGIFLLPACKRQVQKKTYPVSNVKHPEWSKNTNIYEVNLRQFTQEGTFTSFIRHMPRLRNMGVDILWFMPIHPIGLKNRKGPLGSYYSVQDYYNVNPEFGTFEEFQMVVKLAHELGMYVLMDWVANHTAWDHEWVTKHPEWYARNRKGEMYSPHDWTDVVQLDYSNEDLRVAMIEAMKFWVKEADVDGFRCDVAAMVPVDFWETARAELDKIKPVFLLAEADEPELLINAFDMDYGWKLHHICNQIAKGKEDASAIQRYFDDLQGTFPEGAYRMYFTSNHDENSWHGTEFERMGDGANAFFVLMATVPGMPLVYTGQEAALNRRLKFFEKDPVSWTEIPLAEFYRTLLNLKKRNPALWNGEYGGTMKRINTSNDKAIYAFQRIKDNNRVTVLLNLTDKEQNIKLQGEEYMGIYNNVFKNEIFVLKKEMELTLKPWEYLVLEQIQ